MLYAVIYCRVCCQWTVIIDMAAKLCLSIKLRECVWLAGGGTCRQAANGYTQQWEWLLMSWQTDRPLHNLACMVHGGLYSLHGAKRHATELSCMYHAGFASSSAHRWLVDMRSNAFPVTKARRHIIAVFILSYIGPPSSSILQYSFPF